jgi:hypothetical protein
MEVTPFNQESDALMMYLQGSPYNTNSLSFNLRYYEEFMSTQIRDGQLGHSFAYIYI